MSKIYFIIPEGINMLDFMQTASELHPILHPQRDENTNPRRRVVGGDCYGGATRICKEGEA